MIIMLAMVDETNSLTAEGKDQPFLLRRDMTSFRKITTGGNVVYGRKTLETFPNKAPLKLRHNYILTHAEHLSIQSKYGDTHIIHDIDSIKDLARAQTVFVIGGASVYKQAFDMQIAQFAILTRVKTAFSEPALKFPELRNNLDWTNIMNSILFDDTTAGDDQHYQCMVEFYHNTKLNEDWFGDVDNVIEHRGCIEPLIGITKVWIDELMPSMGVSSYD